MTGKAQTTIDRITKDYGSEMAVCNFGVQRMFEALFPNEKPPGMSGLANAMAEAWKSNPDHWQAISLSDAQQYANDGYFVVAGYINPNPNRSGHVVVVVPGTETFSKKWGMTLPCIMDTGAYKRACGIPLSTGFGPDKKSDIKFYYYKK